MAPLFSFPRPTTMIDRLEQLYMPILDVLAELGLLLTQMCPNFLRLLLVLLVKAHGEGLLFGLDELRHLCLMKQNNQNPGTFLLSPRPGRQIIQNIPYRDQNWREEYFFFKFIPRVPRCLTSFEVWSEFTGEVVRVCRCLTRIRAAFAMLGGTNRASLVIGGSEDEAEHSQEVIATPSVQVQSSDRLVRQLVRRSSFRTSGSTSRSKASDISPLISIRDSDDEDVPGKRRSPVSLSPGSEDEPVAANRKRRGSSKAALPGSSCSEQESTVRRLATEGDGLLFAAQDDMISLAQRMRSAGCRLPSLTSPIEK
ncbi:hypothetical protein F2Q68_00027895 [Brassica cretica]|uniref:Uncharacterized protein n=1 Tax=Brassica cretica TaxID=69181 RepID=A0A8S9I9G5_BRACR|nr:hypothetical protein F2Q68_00027895 [Brassica cretica]